MTKFLFLVSFVLFFTSCDVYKSLRFGGVPNQNSYKHFPQRKILNETPTFNFIQPKREYELGNTISVTNKDLKSTNISLDSFVNIHKTISFLIIRNDTILYEKPQPLIPDASSLAHFMKNTTNGIPYSPLLLLFQLQSSIHHHSPTRV